MNKRNIDILSNNPYEQEQRELYEYQKLSNKFYKLLLGELELENDLTELQLEAIIELINIFNKEIRFFEENIESNLKAKKTFETIFLRKNKFYEGVLKKYSRYISVICLGKISNIIYINFKTLGNEFRKGLQEILDVAERDIPKYDLLFDEMDSLQNQNKKFEVYLGRDGIYAYEGRRAADVARRRSLSKEDSEKRQVIKIDPKYINFNTFIKEHYPDEIKMKYLESNGILPSQDLVIFDTGFTGSIPEQILKTLGFKDPDINHRIKILGTHYYKNSENVDINEVGLEKMERIQSRLVKGIKPNYQSYVHVDIIEERAKKTMTASGLYEDKDKKIKPAEKPHLNVLLFYYELIELTIRQYYFNKELYKN